MPLLTESGNPLLTESGQEFLAEDETGIPGQIGLRGKATLKLAAQGALSGIANPISISGKATLKAAARASLSGATGFDWYRDIPANEAGSTPFTIVQEGPGGTPCFRSGAIPNYGTSHARLIAPSAGIMTVWFKVSSETNYDWLSARKAGAPIDLFRISGETTWENATVILAAGEALDIRYTKDSSQFSGQDAGWITVSFEEDACKLAGKATLRLAGRGTLSGGELLATPKPLQGRATLRLVSTAKLSKPKTLNGRATLRLVSRHGALSAPTGLNALMKVITDSAQPEVVLDQYVMVWFYGHPNQCEIALHIDDGPQISPSTVWLNPGTTGPAILKIGINQLQGDGFTHKVTVKVRTNFDGRTGAWAQALVFGKIPKPITTDQPEWCEAVRLRQGGPGQSGPVTDLTRIRWRHDGAVRIMARIPVLVGAEPRKWGTKEIVLGYADYDETEFIAEGVGLKLEYMGGSIRNVEFGVCAIDRGSFGPVFWASAKIGIAEIRASDQLAPDLNPDQRAGTNWALTYPVFKTAVSALVQEQATNWPGNGWFIVHTTLDQTVRKIKDVVRQGGSVTLDDFARFEARWDAERTTRSVGCSLSTGLKEGTKQGRIMTDEEAKAAKEAKAA